MKEVGRNKKVEVVQMLMLTRLCQGPRVGLNKQGHGALGEGAWDVAIVLETEEVGDLGEPEPRTSRRRVRVARVTVDLLGGTQGMPGEAMTEMFIAKEEEESEDRCPP